MAAPPEPKNNADDQQNKLAEQVLKEQVVDQSVAPPQPQNQSFFRRFFTIKKVLVVFGIFILLLVILLAFSRFRNNQITPAKGDGEVVWWTIKEDAETIRPLVDEFEKENPNIRVVIRPQSEKDYVERLNNALKSSNPPEIFEIHKSWIPMFRNLIYPMPKTVMTRDQFKNEFYSVVFSDLTTDRGVMAMPLYYDALAFYINQDIFTRAAASPPETWVQLEELAPNFTQKSNNNLVIQSGVALGFSENVDYWQEVVALLMYQNGASLSNPSGARAELVLEYIKDLEDEKVWDTRLPSTTDFFTQDSLAMYFAPTIEASYIIQQNPNLRFRTELLPQIPKGDPSDPDYSYSTYYAHSVSAGAGDRDSAWKLLKFLSEDERLIQLNQNREEKGLYPRIYPRPSMANLQNADPILGSVVALIPQAKGWYLNDDQIEGETSLSDQISQVYETAFFERQNIKDLGDMLKSLLKKHGISTK